MGLTLCSLSKAKQKGFQSNKNEAIGPFLDHLGCLVGAGLVKQGVVNVNENALVVSQVFL